MAFNINKTINTNITFAFQAINPLSVNFIEMEEKLNKLLDEEVKPVITRFPELTGVLLPKQQISIVIDNRRLTTTDQSITNFEERKTDLLVDIGFLLLSFFLESKMVAYGFNTSLSLELEDSAGNSGKFLTNLFLGKKAEKISAKIDTTKIFASGYRFFFHRNGNKKRYDLRLEPKFDQKLSPTKTLLVSQNVHFATSKKPSKKALKESYSGEYSLLLQRLTKILVIPKKER